MKKAVFEAETGGDYVEQLAIALNYLGFKVLTDATLEGSDAYGLLACKSPKTAKALKEAMDMVLDGDEEDLDQNLSDFESLAAGPEVVHIVQDWKHLDWRSNAKFLKSKLGLVLKKTGDSFSLSLS